MSRVESERVAREKEREKKRLEEEAAAKAARDRRERFQRDANYENRKLP